MDVKSKDKQNSGGVPWVEIILNAAIAALAFELVKIIIKRVRKEGAAAEAQSKLALSKRVGRNLDSVSLNEYEKMISEDVVDRDALDTTFSMIGGLGSILDEIRDEILFPLVRPDLFRSIGGSSKLLASPKGVLFFGKPGTGKTMLAKAIAKESGATLINLRQSTLQNKWFGESTKMVAAVFSLAVKLSPTIIFIDEVDCFLGTRTNVDAHASLCMKTEFMTLWDGMLSDSMASGVMVLAATNRPEALDGAIQRRLSRSFEVALPDAKARVEILALLLKDEQLDADVKLSVLAGTLTQGYSGSDLHAMCSTAVVRAMQDLLRDARENNHTIPSSRNRRPLRMDDFIHALEKVKKTGASAEEYELAQELEKQQIESRRSLNSYNNSHDVTILMKEFITAIMRS